jgi:hypothetical protein
MIKIAKYLSVVFIKDFQATGKPPAVQRETQSMNVFTSSLWVFFACLDPDPKHCLRISNVLNNAVNASNYVNLGIKLYKLSVLNHVRKVVETDMDKDQGRLFFTSYTGQKIQFGT